MEGRVKQAHLYEPYYGEPMSGRDVSLWAQESFSDAAAHREDDLELAERLSNLYAGRLLNGEELQYLRDTERPNLDINLIRGQVEAMVGLFLAESKEVAFEGIGLDSNDQVLAEWLRRVVRVVWQRGKFQTALTSAAREHFYLGEAHVEIYLDMQARRPVLELCHVPYREAYPDPASQKQHYADRQFFLRRREYPLERAISLYPGSKAVLERMASMRTGTADVRPVTVSDLYGPDGTRYRSRSSVRILDFQYRRPEPVAILRTSQGEIVVGQGQAREAARVLAMTTREEPEVITGRSKDRYYRSIVVEGAPDDEATIVTVPLGDAGWLTHSVTGYPDTDYGSGRVRYFGLGKGLYSQQEWFTRVLQTQLDYLARASKGLTDIQADAVDDLDEFKRQSARPQGIRVVKDLNGIQYRPPAPGGTGMSEFVQFLMSSFASSGVPDSFRGAVSTYRSGSFVQNQSSNAERALLSLIAGMAELQINIGRTVAQLVQDPRIIDDEFINRILEPMGAPLIGLTHELQQDPETGEEMPVPIPGQGGQPVTPAQILRDVDILEFDVATDLGRGSVAERQMVTQMWFQDGLLGQMMQSGIPMQQFVPKLLELALPQGTLAKELTASLQQALAAGQAAQSEEGMLESLKAMGPEAAQEFMERAMTEIIGANAPQPNAQGG
jgi:hypothetical protein